MNTILKKYIPQAIGLLLVVAIIIVAYFAFFYKKAPTNIYIPDSEIMDTSYENENKAPPTYIRAIPKQSQSSETFLYSQSITGDGNTLFKNAFKTSTGNYIVCETDCKNGDIQSDKRAVGIALLDDLANISKVYTIPSQQSSYYVNSQITSSGIVIITTNALKQVYYVNIVSYELDSISTLIINYAENCIIYPTRDSFILISEYEEENIVYKYANEKLSFTGILGGNVVTIFEFATYYSMFINSTNGYTIANINKSTLACMNQTHINGYSLISVTPIIEESIQKFILLETNGAVFARKMIKLDNSDSVVAKLGTFSVNNVCPCDNNLVMVCSGRTNGLVYLNYDLTCNYGESGTNYWITSVVDQNYFDGTYYYLTINTSNELILITQRANTTTTTTVASDCQNAGFIFNSNKSLMIVYQTAKNSIKQVEIIGLA